MTFELVTVEIGIDEDGEPITTLVPVPTDTPSPKDKPLSAALRYALMTLLDAGGLGGARVEAWREVFYRGHSGDNAEAKRKAFQRARRDLIKAALSNVKDDVYTVTDGAGNADAMGMVAAAALTGTAGQDRDKTGTVPVPKRTGDRDGRDTPLGGVPVVPPGGGKNED